MPEPAAPTSPAPRAVKPKPKRRRGGFFNLLLVIAIIAAIGAFIWAEQQRRDTASRLEQTKKELEEIRQISQQQGQQVTQEVLGKVRQHFDVPEEPQPTVATIIDIDALRDTNQFYEKAKNGDHLIITTNRAILYAPDRDLILDVVPVQFEPVPTPTPGEAGEAGTAGETAGAPAEETAPPAGRASPAANPAVSPSPAV